MAKYLKVNSMIKILIQLQDFQSSALQLLVYKYSTRGNIKKTLHYVFNMFKSTSKFFHSVWLKIQCHKMFYPIKKKFKPSTVDCF